MNTCKRVVFGIIIIVTIGVVFWGNHIMMERPSQMLSEYINQGKLVELNLTIYFVDPSILTYIPVDIEGLKEWGGDNKITVNGSQLAEHISLINQMINTDLSRVNNKDKNSYLNARIYYLFETNYGKNVYDVAMWCDARGDNESIIINGRNYKSNDIFYNVIFPFLPEDYAQVLVEYISLGKYDE